MVYHFKYANMIENPLHLMGVSRTSRGIARSGQAVSLNLRQVASMVTDELRSASTSAGTEGGGNTVVSI